MKLFPRSLGAVLSLTMGAGLMMGTLPPAHADTFTFVTPTGATTGGGPVSASATFTTSANQISVSLSNLQANITDVAQALSDLFFTYSGGNLTGQTLTSSSGQAITVASNGTFSLGSTVPAGWALSAPASNTLLLNDLGAAGPHAYYYRPTWCRQCVQQRQRFDCWEWAPQSIPQSNSDVRCFTYGHHRRHGHNECDIFVWNRGWH